jgi:hypothetical protein
MAIVVSLAQTCSVQKQTRLLEQETQLTEAQALPHFIIRMQAAPRAVQASQTATPVDMRLTVENTGGVIYELREETRSRLLIADGETVAFPLVNVFETETDVGNGTGTLLSLRSLGASEKLARISSAFPEAFFGEPAAELSVMLHLEYKDVLRRPHDDYFEVTADHTVKMSDREATPVFHGTFVPSGIAFQTEKADDIAMEVKSALEQKKEKQSR